MHCGNQILCPQQLSTKDTEHVTLSVWTLPLHPTQTLEPTTQTPDPTTSAHYPSGLTCGVTLLLSSSLNIANLFTVLSMFLYESVLCAVCLGLVVVVCLGGLRAYHMVSATL